MSAKFINKKTYAAAGIFLIIIIFAHVIGWLKPLENFTRAITLPPLTSMHSLSVKVGDNYRLFKNSNDFFSAYAACVAANADSSVLNAQVKNLTDENSALRAQLNFQKRASQPAVVAEVIGREVFSNDQIIIINRGTDSGLKVDQPVIAGDGILVGRLIKVDANTALARLINDNQSRVAGTVLNSDHSLGVVEGGYGLSLQMNFIPRDEVVRLGDQIITSGLELATPRGLLIGTVTAVENEPYEPFQQAIIAPGLDLNKLVLVSVLLTN